MAGSLGSVTRLGRRQQAAMAESEITADALLARALQQGRLPVRRFRLEGTGIGNGNSRLLSADGANGAWHRYGCRGRVVEVVTRAAFLSAQAKNLPACQRSSCGAAASMPCTQGGARRAPHPNRLGLPDKGARPPAGAGLAPCARCGAAADAPCVRKQGGVRKVAHKGRSIGGAA